ncbi:MAG: nucleotidyltransferase domain-containing protein [Methanoregula sp.]
MDDICLFSRSYGPLEADVRAVTEQVLCHYDRVQQAYLYGSFLHNDTYQDIDIAILLSGSMEPYALFKLQMQIAGEIEELLSPQVPCDVRVLNAAPVEFQYEVIKTGSIVFSRSEEQKIDYETDIMRQYLDLKYLFDRVDQAFLFGVSR